MALFEMSLCRSNNDVVFVLIFGGIGTCHRRAYRRDRVPSGNFPT